PNETGTVLSVNADWWGTNITYIGYFLLFFGMFATLFWKGTHFWSLNSQLKNLNKKKLMLIPFLFATGLAFSQQDTIHSHDAPQQIEPTAQFTHPDALGNRVTIDKAHAEKFGKILVQDFEGRIKPMNTHTLDLIRKIYKKDNFEGITSDQWFISLQIDPASWANVPLIFVKNVSDKLNEEANVNADGYTSYLNLIDPQTGQYKLEKQYNLSFSKRPADRAKYDDEVINLTERFNVFNNVAYGNYTKIIPVQNDPSELWTSWLYSTEESPVEIDSIAYGFISNYLNSVKKGIQTGFWQEADQSLSEIDAYQKKWGKNVLPSETKVNIEILYNKFNIFLWLMIAYCMVGGVLIILTFIEVLNSETKTQKFTHYLTNTFIGILILIFLLHAVGLATRWYLSGHAPWSNGYEAIIFISWIGVLAGLLLYKNRNAFIPATGAIVAMIMMGFAHGGGL